jgi:hypothetical protein
MSVATLRAVVLGAVMLCAGMPESAIASDGRDAGVSAVPKQQEEEWAMWDRLERNALGFATVYSRGVIPPLGRWVLLRKDKALCAIRFTEFHRTHPKDRQIRWPEESFFAEYDWIYQGDGSEDFGKSNVQAGHRQADRRPNVWRFERGTKFVQCASHPMDWWQGYSLRVNWSYPTTITLVPRKYDPPGALGVTVALTGWREITEVNSQDPRLVWHRYGPPREREIEHDKGDVVLIPVENLPGGKPD